MLLILTFPNVIRWITDVFISTVLRRPAVKRAVGIPETAHLAAPVTPAVMANAVTLPSPPKRSGKKSKR